MTPKQIEYRYLSLHCWLMRVVAPTTGAVLIALFFVHGLSSEKLRDHTAVLVGFAALYFILIRGGHIIMVRSLHNDMLKRYEADYRERLSQLNAQNIRGNISFALTRIKRDILDKAK
jgi:cytochrome b subunit of formate dehydrogenase